MAEPATAPVATEPTAVAATSAPATEPTGWMGNTGEFRDGAPEAIQGLLEAKKWTNVEQMATAYSELEKFKGAGNGVIIPEADDENYAAKIGEIFGMLGKPESADKYEYTAESNIPLDDALLNGFKEFAHGQNYTQEQLKGAIDFQLDAIAAQEDILTQQLETKKADDTASLQKIYGINYDAAMNDAKLTSDKHGYTEDLANEGVYDLPVVKQLLNHIANLEAEDGVAPGGPAPVTKSLQEQLDEIKADPAFMNKFAPGRKELMERFKRINQEIANSGQAPVRRQA